jgi:hypothetical protein
VQTCGKGRPARWASRSNHRGDQITARIGHQIADDAGLDVNSFHLCRSETLLLLVLRGQGWADTGKGRFAAWAGGRSTGATENKPKIAYVRPDTRSQLTGRSLTVGLGRNARLVPGHPEPLRQHPCSGFRQKAALGFGPFGSVNPKGCQMVAGGRRAFLGGDLRATAQKMCRTPAGGMALT